MQNEEKLIDISISKEMESSFIDYAMSVIVSRAIPDVRDGLKPVHRRILYAMNELEMLHNKPFKKSARVVGEVLAKYHPHGDSAAYESMVRMAQSFSLRYPLIWGQGNFGSIDGDSAAAMRYTEVKLKKITNLMLDDIDKNTVVFQANYDGSETEPTVLPAKIPNILINGSTGIAVGMATSIPPHNLREVLNASDKLLANPNIEIAELLQYLPAPDFPTGGILINKNEVQKAYLTGRGRALVRAKTKIEFNEKESKGKIIINEIPYLVNKSNLIQKIVELVKLKQIESISEIRDESNREGIRIVINLKKGYLPEVELNKLFKLTQLQNSFSINMLALSNGKPATMNIKEILQEYIAFQKHILIKKTNFLLEKAKARKHILEGLSIALNNIDEIIKTIKESSNEETAINKLMNNFKLSELQSKSVLAMRLQRLTGLERKNLEGEIENLQKEIDDHNLILNSEEAQKERIRNQITQIEKEFGDERRTEISNLENKDIQDEDLIPRENVVVTMSQRGYIKRLSLDEYKTQGRGGVGVKGANLSDEDFISKILVANTHTDLLFFTNKGRVFKLRVHEIPSLSKQAKGIPLINLIDLSSNEEKVTALLEIEDYSNSNLLFFTTNGLVKMTDAVEFKRVNKNGKIALNLRENDSLLGVSKIERTDEVKIMIANSNGKTIKFDCGDLRSLGRTASGVKGINLDDGKAVDFGVSTQGNNVLTISELGYGKLTNINEYRETARGSKGVISINVEKAGLLVALKIVEGEEDLIIITDKGTIIRLNLSSISEQGRNTKGVKVIKLKEGEKIISAVVVKSFSKIEEDIEETLEKEIK